MITRNKLLPLLAAGVILAASWLSGCGNVVELSPAEEAAWEQEQTALFADVQLPEFSVQTLNGQTVTDQDCFRTNRLTLVNIWGTFCSPCIEEMPELARLYQNLPQGVNLISICTDADATRSNLRFAKRVMQEAKAKFSTLIPDQALKQALTDRVTAFPTTLFIDSTGKVVGSPYCGADTEAGYQEEITRRLEMLPAEGEAQS